MAIIRLIEYLKYLKVMCNKIIRLTQKHNSPNSVDAKYEVLVIRQNPIFLVNRFTF